MKQYRKIRWVALGILTLAFVSFQNCGGAKVNFAGPQQSSQTLGTTTVPPVLSCPAPRTAISGSSCVCPNSSNWNGSQCVVCSVTTTWDPATTQCVNPQSLCQNFIDLSAAGTRGGQGDVVNIPARDSTGSCYYLKMVSVYPGSGSDPSSEVYVNMRNDIFARDHDGLTPHPRIIENPNAAFVDPTNLELVFQMLGKRNLILAADSQGTQSVSVDNFVLAEFFKPSGSSFWGSGTADAPNLPTDLTYPNQLVVVNNSLPYQVDYYPNQAGGTATFDPVDLSRYINFDQNGESEETTARITSLDCGGVGGTTDVYLLFR